MTVDAMWRYFFQCANQIIFFQIQYKVRQDFVPLKFLAAVLFNFQKWIYGPLYFFPSNISPINSQIGSATGKQKLPQEQI